MKMKIRPDLKARLLRLADTLEKLEINEFNLPEAVVEFFKDKAATSADAEKFAKELGVEKADFDAEVYKLLNSLINSKSSEVGRHSDVSDDNFDPEELKMGIEVEKEHTDDEAMAKAIAKDHLSEIKNYYSLLKEMEAKGDQAEGCVGCGDEADGCEGCDDEDISAGFGSSSCVDCQKILSEFLDDDQPYFPADDSAYYELNDSMKKRLGKPVVTYINDHGYSHRDGLLVLSLGCPASIDRILTSVYGHPKTVGEGILRYWHIPVKHLVAHN